MPRNQVSRSRGSERFSRSLVSVRLPYGVLLGLAAMRVYPNADATPQSDPLGFSPTVRRTAPAPGPTPHAVEGRK